MKKSLLLIAVVSTSWVQAQNLVPNWSFEDTTGCPSHLNQLFYTKDWYKPTNGTSDYFNICSNTTAGVPDNYWGMEPAHSGFAYAGIITYNEQAPNIREYLQVELKDTLKLNTKYDVSFYVSRGDYSKYSCNTIGAFLSSTAINAANGNLPYSPQIFNLNTNPLVNPGGWYLISGSMFAKGGEKFITIGNFSDDASSTIFFVGGPGPTYYYIDDVSVVEGQLGINDMYGSSLFNIYPNPGNGVFKIKWLTGNGGAADIEVYNVFGEVVHLAQIYSMESEIDLKSQMNGMYFLRIRSETGTSVQKIVIQK